jgi:hypothetical protein
MAKASEDISAELDPAALRALLADVRGFDKHLYTGLRRELRGAGESGVKAVQARILSAPARTDVGLRRGLAAGVRVAIRNGAKAAGVSITETGSKLPADKRVLVKLFDKPSFRHRVYGGDTWVTQAGRPNFGSVLDERKADMQAAAQRALNDALRTIGEATTT